MQLAFACQCRAENCGEFKRSEFVAGCEVLDVTSVQALKARLAQLRASYDDPRQFERIYNFTFPFMCEPGKKIMDLEQALALWRQLFAGRNAWAHTGAWCEFLEAEHGRPIVADTWRLLLPFRKVRRRCCDHPLSPALAVAAARSRPFSLWQQSPADVHPGRARRVRRNASRLAAMPALRDGAVVSLAPARHTALPTVRFFVQAHDKSFEDFKADEAWPVLIDEFVEWMQERQQ